MSAQQRVVLLDTDVFSALFVTPEAKARSQGYLLDQWRAAVRGYRVVIAFQTRAEALVGAGLAKWGARRTQALCDRLDETPTVGLDTDVVDAYVTLTVEASALGIGLSHKDHVADRWIAACAIAKAIPLLSGDRIFKGAPSLSLLALPELPK